MSEEQAKYRTYIAFSSADAVPVYAGIVLPEVSSIQWEDDFRARFAVDKIEQPIKGYIDVSIFGGESSLMKAIRDNGPFGPFEVNYANEIGEQAKVTFVNFNIEKRSGGLEADSIIEQERYYFVASDVVREEILIGIVKED